MDVLVAQFLCLFGLFLSMIAFTLVPMWLVPSMKTTTMTEAGRRLTGIQFVESDKYETFVGLANCLSGGVFLATFFMGLLPEVRHEMNEILQEAGIFTSFPPTELVVVLGFFLAMFVEQLALSVKSGGGHSHGRAAERHNKDEENVCVGGRGTPSMDEIDDSPVVVRPPITTTVVGASHHMHGHGHSHDVEALLDPASSGGVRFGILIVSLGVHSLFEGMALGLQTEVHIMLNLFVGVWIHECLIAFALGFSMLRAMSDTNSVKSKCRFVRMAVLFSALIPAGQLLGLVVGSSRSWTSRVLNAILQAIAAGTFIQVTFLDIIPEGLEAGGGNRAAKVTLIFFGFLCIAVVTFFVQAHHAH